MQKGERESFAVQPADHYLFPIDRSSNKSQSHIDRLCLHEELEIPSVDLSAHASVLSFQGTPGLAGTEPSSQETPGSRAEYPGKAKWSQVTLCGLLKPAPLTAEVCSSKLTEFYNKNTAKGCTGIAQFLPDVHRPQAAVDIEGKGSGRIKGSLVGDGNASHTVSDTKSFPVVFGPLLYFINT